MHKSLTKKKFVCFTMGVIDPASRIFRFSNCGCPYPYHYKAATGEVLELQLDAYPLGIRPEAAYEEAEIQLQSGDRIIFCSDGIIEATDAHETLFSFERTAETICAGCTEGLSAQKLIDLLIDTVHAFAGNSDQEDDMTCIVVQVT